MNIELSLRQFGLNIKEIQVYKAILELGRGTALSISKKAGVKRPTTYLVLEELMEKGLISRLPQKNKTIFVAEDPKKILKILETRKKNIENVIPDLLGLYNKKVKKPHVEFYEGKKGVEEVYKQIMEVKEIWWYGNLFEVSKNFSFIYNYYEKLMKEKKAKIRDLIGNSKWEKEYAKTNQSSNHQIRVCNLPVNMDLSIFEDKIAIISLKDEYYGVVIKHKSLSDSIRSLYELAWKGAGEFKEK